MNHNYEKQYKDLIKDILINGAEEPVRDNNVAKVLFGKQLEFSNNSKLFPMLTSKEMYFKNVRFELKWILDGLTNVNYLKNNGVSIWNKWADENGEIGDTYGKQLRSFNGIDQLKVIISEFEKEFPQFKGIGSPFPIFKDTPVYTHITNFLRLSLQKYGEKIEKEIAQ